ncbi:cell wall hydrolase [Prosthecomicrobium hirschii]|uniref:cell wall hydrolase n=1 Tax=Prosthecodimorpha hirschii TaxID=665126 RepID=UPI00221EA8FF|nr:cell wall hydrolase [Prosthecomicrobium hirschii]MCW1840663.1 cell wall hydrolase [Prosthecomicrobium hirschii]
MRPSKGRIRRVLGIAGLTALSVPAIQHFSAEPPAPKAPGAGITVIAFAPPGTAWFEEYSALRTGLAGTETATADAGRTADVSRVADSGRALGGAAPIPALAPAGQAAGLARTAAADQVVTGAITPDAAMRADIAAASVLPAPAAHKGPMLLPPAPVPVENRKVAVLRIPVEPIETFAADPAVSDRTGPVAETAPPPIDASPVPPVASAAPPAAGETTEAAATLSLPSADAGVAGGFAPAPWIMIHAAATAPNAAGRSAGLAPAATEASASARRRMAARTGSRGRDFAPEAQVPMLGYANDAPDVEAPFRSVLGEPGAKAGIGPKLPANMHAWAYADLPAGVDDQRQQKCLAEAIYFEARGENERGQAAVAQVVLNRLRNPAYPKRICDVVYQNARSFGRCQFSFACDGRPEEINEPDAWDKAVEIARAVTAGKTYLPEIGDSTHYHATWVTPNWRRGMIRKTRIGVHVFYRTVNGGWI